MKYEWLRLTINEREIEIDIEENDKLHLHWETYDKDYCDNLHEEDTESIKMCDLELLLKGNKLVIEKLKDKIKDGILAELETKYKLKIKELEKEKRNLSKLEKKHYTAWKKLKESIRIIQSLDEPPTIPEI